jgi:Uma2 family endonuclease
MALHRTTQDPLISGEELFRQPDSGACELVEGKIVPMTPTGYLHGAVEARLAARLLAWAEAEGRGRVLAGEVGIYVRRAPDTVRAADVVFLSEERFARCTSAGYLDVAPELVVEVLSPEDRWSGTRGVQEKVAEYLAAGVVAVWIVDPRARRVLIHRAAAAAEVFERAETLADPALLPGFALPLADLFRE